MIELSDSLELSRKEIFCGWYHTHPFEVDVHSNCFLSNTDITTQLQWQRSEDPHGNPWLAIVIDPLFSIAKGVPELMAFRVYPPEYTPTANETPDGTIVKDDKIRVSKWGACWNRYYQLQISYFMSNNSKSTLGILRDKFLWQNTFISSVGLDIDSSNNDRVRMISKKIDQSQDTKMLSTLNEGTVHPLFSINSNSSSNLFTKPNDDSSEVKRIELSKDCHQLGSFQMNILANKNIKHLLFN